MEDGHESQSSSSREEEGLGCGAAASPRKATNLSLQKNNPENGSKIGLQAPVVVVDASPERAPRAYLKSSFAQRLTAQCGSVFIDSNHSPRGCRIDGGGGSSVVESEQRSKLGSGRGSSGLSEADARGMAIVAAEATPAAAPPLVRPTSSAQVLKLWGFPPSAFPRHRAMAMVGASATESLQKRDGSPLGQAQRAACGLETVVRPKPDPSPETKHVMSAVDDARRASSAPRTRRTVVTNDPKLTREQSLPRDSGRFISSLGHLVQPAAAAAAVPAEDTDANVSEAAAAAASSKRPSFKSDCGFLKLLPSKRKFSPEDDAPKKYVLSGKSTSVEGEQAMRLSSNSSGGNVVSKRSLLLHLKSTSANDVTTSASGGGGGGGSGNAGGGGMKEFSRDSSTGKERRVVNHDTVGKPVVGSSFMRWMIDVGKGLAKKRCFGSDQPPVQSTDISPLSSPIAGICTAEQAGLTKHFNMASRMCDSSKPSEDGRTGLSPQSVPQSCQNMDTEEPASDRQIGLSSPNGANAGHEEMNTSGDEQPQHDQERVEQGQPPAVAGDEQEDGMAKQADHGRNDREVVREPELNNTTSPSGDGNGNSQNATEGTTGSLRVSATQQHKEVASAASAAAAAAPKIEVEQTSALVTIPRSRKVSGGEEASFDLWRTSSSLVVAPPDKEIRSPRMMYTSTRGTSTKGAGNAVASTADECSQGMAEFVASMASVKSWVIKNRNMAASQNQSGIGLGLSRAPNTSRKNFCNFCGLGGHAVSDCSETLDCELRDLERRSAVLDDMKTELKDLPCLRCLGMGHLGAQCRFSVTEAASRARENSELRSWNFTRKMASKTTSPSDPQPAAWSQNSNVIAAALQHEVEKRMISNGAAANANANAKINRTSPSDKNAAATPKGAALKERKNETSPKEITYKKIGSTKVTDLNTNTNSKRKSTQSGSELALPPIPKNMLSSIEAVRLSRSELWKWVESPHFNTQVRGFFLRLRFGRWEKDLGGTGYRMARIRGAMKKNGTEEKNMSVSVDLGDLECTVDSQYVSNHPFTEAELVEWWRGRWKSGKRVISEAELQAKMSQRRNL